MCSVKGSIKIAVLTSFALVIILALCFAQTGFTWGQTSAARSVVLAFLREVPPPKPTPEPQVTGREATPEEAAALDNTVNAYLEAIRARQYAAARELTTIGNQMVDQEQFLEGFKLREKDEAYWGDEDAWLFMSGHKTRLVDVALDDDEALAHIAIDVSQPLWLALVKREGTWRIEPLSGDEAAAREDVARQLEEMHLDTTNSILRQMLRQQSGETFDYLRLLIVSPQTASHRVISRKVDADHAVVKLQTQGELHTVVPMRNDAAGWRLNFRDTIRLVAPNFRLERRPSEQTVGRACLRNVRQLALGMLQYCQDYDEKLPPANKWSSVTTPYLRYEAVLNCPAVEKYGYAMNYKLSRAELSQVIQPARTIMLFDSTLLRPNAYDAGAMPGASLPDPPRHEGLNNAAFTDGHGEALIWGRPSLGWYRLEGPQEPPDGPGGPPGDGPGGKKGS